jgi:copper transport protein
MSHGALAILANWLTFVALFLVVGSAGARLVAARADVTLPSCRMLGSSGAALALVAALLRLLAQALNFLDPGDPLTHDAFRAVLHTTWGTGWACQVAAAVLALFMAGTARFAPVAAVLIAFTLPLTGHAADFPLGFPAGVVVHGFHGLAAAGWLGTLGVMMLAWNSQRRTAGVDAPVTLARLVQRFSPVALTSALVMAVTGAITAVTMLKSWEALFGTTYGRLLLAKLAVLLAVLALGAMNWRVYGPALARAPSNRRLLRSATAEVVLALVILGLTGSLVSASPM